MNWSIILCVVFRLSKLNGDLVSKPPHTGFIPSQFKYDHIMSANEDYRQEVINKIINFPLSNYNIYTVKNLGLFFLDAKSDCIKDILKEDQLWEDYIVPLIQKYAKPSTVVLDVGAHIGTHTLSLSCAVGLNGMVIAFEPQPKIFCELFMNAELNQTSNIWYFWSALGDRIEEIILANFHPLVEAGYLFDYQYGVSENYVPMITLDSLHLNNISFMKVDVDGCDDIFLDGAKETILRNKPVIIMEIMGGWDIDTATPEQKQIILHTQNKIKNLGYKLEKVYMHDYLCLPIDI